MATRTILDNIVIRDSSKCRKLLRALDKAMNTATRREPKVIMKRQVTDMTDEQMELIFGKKNP
jgi:hypothetical protein